MALLKIPVSTGLILLLIFSCAGLSAEYLRLTNDQLEIRFEKAHNAVQLKEIKLRKRGGLITTENVDSQHTMCPIWELQLEGHRLLNSNWARVEDWKSSGNQIRITWRVENYRITATITVEENTTLWDFDLRSTDGKSFVVESLKYPVIGDIVQDNVKFAAPFGWGHEYASAQNISFEKLYPTYTANMQFLSYYHTRSGDGLYIGARDTTGIQKLIKNRSGSSAIPYAREEITMIPERRLTTAWQLPYQMEVRPYIGDWYEGAQIYREFVNGWKKANRDKHSWIFDTDVFLFAYLPDDPGNTFENYPYPIEKVVSDLGIQHAAVHLYNWHKHRFDDMYPDYFPPRKGFAAFLARMKSNNVKIIPYVNARIADIRVAQENPGYFQNACEYGQSEFLRSNFNVNEFLVMCPNTSFWQEKIRGIAGRLIDYGVDGIYYDQVGTAASWRCINTTHGHAPDHQLPMNMASGNRWVAGVNRLFDRRVPVMSEDNAEPYDVDIHLMFNNEVVDPAESFTLIPLFTAVYSDKVVMTSFGVHFMHKGAYFDAAMLKLSYTYLYGSQLARLMPQELLANRKLFDFFKQLVKARSANKAYFNYGQMMRPPRIETADSVRLTERLTEPQAMDINFTRPSLMASLWKNPQSYLLSVINYSGKPARGTLRVDLPSGDFELTPLVPGGQRRKINGKNYRHSVDIPARTIQLFELTPKGN